MVKMEIRQIVAGDISFERENGPNSPNAKISRYNAGNARNHGKSMAVGPSRNRGKLKIYTTLVRKKGQKCHIFGWRQTIPRSNGKVAQIHQMQEYSKKFGDTSFEWASDPDSPIPRISVALRCRECEIIAENSRRKGLAKIEKN